MEKIKVACSSCQAKLAVPEAAAGKTIRCPKCQSHVQVPPAVPRSSAPPAPPKAERPEPQPRRPKKSPSRQPVEDYFGTSADKDDDSNLEFLPSDTEADSLDWDEAPQPRKKRRTTDAPYRPPESEYGEKRSARSSVNSKAIYSGVGMIVLSVVWFFGALLFLDRIFFYPPILLIIGIVTIFKGLKGED